MDNIWNSPCVFTPSLICLDLCNLERDVKVLEQNQMEDRTIRIPKVLVPWVGTDVLS